jgi:hypothetical protein
MGDMIQPAVLKVERNSKNQIRHHHDHLERAELIRAEPEWSERLTSGSRTRFGTDQHRGSGEVRDILILFPTVPEVCGPGTPALGLAFNQCDRLSDTRATTPLLVLPIDEIGAVMKNVRDSQPLVLDSAKVSRNGF